MDRSPHPRTTTDRNRTGNFRHSNQCRLFGLHEGIRDLKGVDFYDIRKTEKADYKGCIRKRGHAEQIRCILDGEPHYRGTVSGTCRYDGVML